MKFIQIDHNRFQKILNEYQKNYTLISWKFFIAYSVFISTSKMMGFYHLANATEDEFNLLRSMVENKAI